MAVPLRNFTGFPIDFLPVPRASRKVPRLSRGAAENGGVEVDAKDEVGLVNPGFGGTLSIPPHLGGMRALRLLASIQRLRSGST